MSDTLFDPTKIGAIAVNNRVAMAPLTRARADMDGVQTQLAVDYYRRRASAGMIIAEATNISRQARGYAYTPGIYTDAHVKAWRPVTQAVHDAGGRIVLQLWHTGRFSHTSLQEGGQPPVAPSAIQAGEQTYLENGFERPSPPRALETDEIPGIIADYVRAAATGADLALFSAQKYLGAPTAGLVLGRRGPVAAVRAQDKGIGRAMKAGKEAIAGVMAALEYRERLDLAEWERNQEAKVRLLLRLLQQAGARAWAEPDPTGNAFARVEVVALERIVHAWTNSALVARARSPRNAAAPTPSRYPPDVTRYVDGPDDRAPGRRGRLPRAPLDGPVRA